ncbi:Rop guanine nucleotide exchange factor 2 [Cardamine amara subsp. amara]|uniref:Rop guanine nucleotide exchange factor 2 n=1 Tax=Cardamine amara subsp. amara TaxID=228776 RepID=A0ABD1BU55_CARAN
MVNLSNTEESDDVCFRQSPGSIDPNDHSASESPVYSTMSTDSFAYHSETSGGFSDQIDETRSFCSEVSPSDWPVLTQSKSDSSNFLTTLEAKQRTFLKYS